LARLLLQQPRFPDQLEKEGFRNMLDTNKNFAEQVNIIAFPPIDLANAAGLITPYVSLKNYSRATLILHKGAGGAAEAPTITLDQATAVAGTGSKALASITRIHKKESAADLETVALWTLVTQAAAATFVGGVQLEGLYAIDIKAEDLDVDNGYDCFRASIADVGVTAQLAAFHCVLWGQRYSPGLTPLAN
jgi:hypothetical protein